MKKTVQRTSKFKAFWGMLALVLVFGSRTFAENLAFVSHAESAAKVTASSAKIRKSADSSSEVIGSAAKDKTISIKSQTKGADGYTWYEVYVDANTPIYSFRSGKHYRRIYPAVFFNYDHHDNYNDDYHSNTGSGSE